MMLLSGLIPPRASAQDEKSEPPQNSPSYLMRMERFRTNEHVCVLLRGDGQYHLENELLEETEVFEGSLALPDLQKVERLLDSDELFLLSQEKLVAPLIGIQDDLLLTVVRPGHLQTLTFHTPESRKPYETSLNPLLKWLEDLRKEKHVQLTEDAGKNNCLPPAKIEFSTRTAATTTKPPAADSSNTPRSTESDRTKDAAIVPVFTVRLIQSRIDTRDAETSCLIFYPDGRYHRERKNQHIGDKKVTIKIFEDFLHADEVQQLRQILDAPELQSRPYLEAPRVGSFREIEVTLLIVPRGDHIQKLEFWKYVEGFGIGSVDIQNNGMKLLKPFNQWLKSNIEDRKQAPLSSVAPNGCEPVNASNP